MRNTAFRLIVCCLLALGCTEEDEKRLNIVFVTGDEEYRSEESMPMLAEILNRELPSNITICYALDSTGMIDPNRLDNISNLESLREADLMIIFTRFRQLPQNQLQLILDYVESGKPIVGFRTSTHAFLYPNDSTKSHLFEQWPVNVFGQKWITHHGHFGDGQEYLTSVSLNQDQIDHPILNGIEPFDAYSWLYHVEGPVHELAGNPNKLLTGIAIRSIHQEKDRLYHFPLENPVAWTKNYTGSSGIPSRVFFTTLGHPYDFLEESMRKLALNGIFWALGREDKIPADGVNALFDKPYIPNNSGFGNKYKPNLLPKQIQ